MTAIRYLTEVPAGGELSALAQPLAITWTQCHPQCPGWVHMEDPCEVQACDACGRFDREDSAAFLEMDGSPRPGIVTDDALARAAHATECGCIWGASKSTCAAALNGMDPCTSDETARGVACSECSLPALAQQAERFKAIRVLTEALVYAERALRRGTIADRDAVLMKVARLRKDGVIP